MDFLRLSIERLSRFFPSEQKRPALVAALFIVGCPVLLMAHVLFSDQIFFFRDFGQLYYPGLKWGIDQLRAGSFPLWNPYIYCGYPVLAATTYGYLYPPFYLLALLPFDFGIKLYIMLHLVWGGWGTYRLCRHLDCSPWASIFGGVAFSLCGPMVSGVHNLCYLTSPSWMPWAFWGYAKFHREKKVAWMLWTSLCMALMALAGEIQTCYLTGLIFCSFSLFHLERKKIFSSLVKSMAALSIIAAISLALAAAQILPGLELAQHSERYEGVSIRNALFFVVFFRDLIRFLVPFIYGNPTVFWNEPIFPFQLSLYPGIVTWILIFLGLFASREKRLKGFLFAHFFLFFLLAFGKELPFYAFFHEWMPFWKTFRYSEKMVLPMFFHGSILAALGLDYLISDLSRHKTKLGLAATSIVAGVMTYGIWRFSSLAPGNDFGETLLSYGSHYVGVFLAFCAFASVYFFKFRKSLIPFSFCLLLSLDLIFYHRQILPTLDRSFYTECSDLIAPFQNNPNHRIAIVEEIVRLHLRHSIPELERMQLHKRWGAYNFGVLHNVQKDSGVIQAFLEPYSYLRYKAQERDILFKRLSASRVVYGFPKKNLDQELLFYDFKIARPRASLVYDIVWAIDWDDAADKMAEIGLESVVLLEGEERLESLPALGKESKVVIQESLANRVTVRVSASSPCYLLLTDNFYPGWKAFVNGKETRIHRAEMAFRLVPLPAGEHEVVFVFRPFSFFLGGVISLFTGLAMAFSLIFLRRKKNALPLLEQGEV